MTLQLGDYLVWGELHHTRPYSLHGILKLRGMEMPVSVQLTGAPSPDLYLKGFRFRPREAPKLPAGRRPRLPFRVHPQQVGPTGRMTAACRVPLTPSAPPESDRPRCLYLEWFSQNGRIVLEIADPILEVCDSGITRRGGEPEWTPLPLPDSWQELSRESTLAGFLAEPDEGEPPPGADIRLDSELSTDELVEQLELMDGLYTSGGGESLRPVIREFVTSTPLVELTDAEAELALKYALAQLALRGVAIHSCEHSTVRDILHYIRTTIADIGECYPPLRKTAFVQNYLLGEACGQCEQELEERFRQYEGENSEPDSPPPF